MTKIISYIAISLNGKIARQNGDVDWLEVVPNPNNLDYGYSDFIKTIGTTIQGHATYRQVIGWDIEFPYVGLDNYVMTTVKEGKDENVQFICENQEKTIRDIKEKASKDIWLIGGGKLNGWFLELGLIDELRVFIMPVILPDGLDLFVGQSSDYNLSLKMVERYETGVIEMRYAVGSSN